MTFTLKTARVTALAVGAAALLGITSTASAWTISGSPGLGTISGTHFANTRISNPTTGGAISCFSASLSGVAPNGFAFLGINLASLTSISSASGTPCSGPGGLSFSLSTSGASFDAVSYATTTQITSGYLRNLTVTATTSPPSPYKVVATGDVPVTYSNTTHRLQVLPGSSMIAIAPTSLFGLFNAGDHVSFSTEFTISPSTLSITNP